MKINKNKNKQCTDFYRDEQIDPLVEYILNDNNLRLIKISDGPNSLQRSLSVAFFFTTNFADQIQEQCFDYLKKSITTGKLPEKLAIFKNNFNFFQEFTQNNNLQGFEKINLELVSLFYNTKITLYNITNDHQLKALIVNNRSEKHVQLLKKGNHYDLIHDKDFYDKINFCRNIANELIDNFHKHLYLSSDGHFESEENEIHEVGSTSKEKQDFDEIFSKPVHKKSMSMQDFAKFVNKDHYYSMFESQKPPEDFMKILQEQDVTKARKKSSFFFSDDFFNYELKSMKLSVKPQSDDQKPQFYFQKLLPPGFDEPNLLQDIISFKKQSNETNIQNGSFNKSEQDNEEAQQALENQMMNFGMNILDQNSNKPNETIVDESLKRFQGRLKFFDENKNYGFIIDDQDQSDIFVHYDDIQKAEIDKEYLKTAKHGNIIRFSFQVMGYVGKYNKSRKAINLILLSNMQNYKKQMFNQNFNLNQNLFLPNDQFNMQNQFIQNQQQQQNIIFNQKQQNNYSQNYNNSHNYNNSSIFNNHSPLMNQMSFRSDIMSNLSL